MRRYTLVKYTTKRNPRAKKGTSRSKAKAYSKKVGNWRCECKGRTVICAGAKHSYRDHATACGVYKRINSVAAVKRFVSRYGKKTTKAAVGAKKGAKVNPKRKKAPRGRRNPPISRAERDAMMRILRRHGYLR